MDRYNEIFWGSRDNFYVVEHIFKKFSSYSWTVPGPCTCLQMPGRWLYIVLPISIESWIRQARAHRATTTTDNHLLMPLKQKAILVESRVVRESIRAINADKYRFLLHKAKKKREEQFIERETRRRKWPHSIIVPRDCGSVAVLLLTPLLNSSSKHALWKAQHRAETGKRENRRHCLPWLSLCTHCIIASSVCRQQG